MMESEQKKISNNNGLTNIEPFDVIRCCGGECFQHSHDLIGEEPLVIRIDGQPYATIMRTPGEETFHAAGFCLAEGIIDNMDDLTTAGYCKDMDANVIEIRLTPERHKHAETILGKKNLMSLSSCGICGRELIEDAMGFLSPVTNSIKINLNDAINKIEELHDNQTLHKSTRGSHAAMLLDAKLEPLSISEDVGRHNALDKAIGRLFMTAKLKDACVCVLSSRISYEMIIKANRARIPIILSASRPTALAVRLGRKLGMTLACIARESELVIFSGEERINRDL
jgi:FdhD protein